MYFYRHTNFIRKKLLNLVNDMKFYDQNEGQLRKTRKNEKIKVGNVFSWQNTDKYHIKFTQNSIKTTNFSLIFVTGYLELDT